MTSLVHGPPSYPWYLNGEHPRAAGVDDARLHRAILYAVAYSDVFDYPLTASEIRRYLIGVNAAPRHVYGVLENGALIPDCLSQVDRFYTLAGRESIVAVRRERAGIAGWLWPYAHFYGEMIARLPFVRMVAVTGELAVNNVRAQSDIDYFIVTEPGRLWLTRAMVILIVKAAGRRGITVCPNYLVTENALTIDVQNLYTAREMVQMVPLFGLETYQRLLAANHWVHQYLPNATGQNPTQPRPRGPGPARRVSERLLRNPIGDRAEQWEMNRKIEKLSRQNGAAREVEVAFSADWCKGHFDGHGHRIMQAFAERVEKVEGLLQ